MWGGIIAKTLYESLVTQSAIKKGAVTSIKKNWKLKDEVGMVGPKIHKQDL